MSDHEVARAIFGYLQQGKLIFVPPPLEVKWHIEEVKTKCKRLHQRDDLPIPNQVFAKAEITRTDLPALLNPIAPSPVADIMATEVGEDIDRLVRKSPGLLADIKRLGGIRLADREWQAAWGLIYQSLQQGHHPGRRSPQPPKRICASLIPRGRTCGVLL
ncbi:hypothetical protein VSR82_14210 [Burkholderia sp. JPY481]